MNDVTVKKLFNDAGLRIYTATPEEELLLLAWYVTLGTTGDLQKLFPSMSQPMSLVLSFFRPPRILLYIERDGAIQFTFWLDPTGDLRAAAGCWIAERWRHHRLSFLALQACYSIAFSRFTVLIGLTKQPLLLKMHEKMGYTVVGEIARGWDGIEKAWLVVFTKEAFEVSRMNPARRTVLSETGHL